MPDAQADRVNQSVRTALEFGSPTANLVLASLQPAASGVPCVSAASPLPAFAVLRRSLASSTRCSTTKIDGTNATVSSVEPSMPVSTAMPIDFCALAPAPLASTSGTTPRMKANDVIRIGRKRERAASTAAVENVVALFDAQLARKLDDQDRILARERDEQDEADLGVEVVADAERQQRRRGAEQRQRHRDDDGQRRDPALVLAGEHEVDEQEAQPVDEVDLVADLLLLVGHRRPFVAGAGRQRVLGDLLQAA